MDKYGIVLNNVSLKNYNTYRIGGSAKYVVKPYDKYSLKELIYYLKNNSYKYIILGKGSNVILPDENYEGVIILLDNITNISINNNIVEVESGIILTKFINTLINNNLGGLENLFGIPGTLGGAIVGNAGCYGSVISDYLIEVTYLENNEIKVFDAKECDFKYRDSIFKKDKNKIVLSAKFELVKSNKEEMLNKIKMNMQKRKEHQPLEYPNAGSVFRNPVNISAGKIIDEMGFKNYNINDAYVSEKHANFIINKGNAQSKDIKELIKIIQENAKEKYGIELMLEQEIVEY